MSCYISSNENRFYVATEQIYGQVASVLDRNRFPAVKLAVKQQPEKIERRDKTGSRTFAGLPAGLRKRTSFDLKTYMTGWTDHTREPGYGPLFQASLGNTPSFFGGGTVQSVSNNVRLQFTSAHNLTPGQAVASSSEIRFVAAVINADTVLLNVPFTQAPAAGSAIGSTVVYSPKTDLPSASIYDYWDPVTAVQRVLSGAAINTMKVKINGDFHEFEFGGTAVDLIDSASFINGQGGLTQYPDEPALGGFDYTIIPGHLGQAWLGTVPTEFLTITSAEVSLDNHLNLRNREFGSDAPRCIVPGVRNISANFTLFEEDDAATRALYQAARQRSPISVMFQLGNRQGQLFGVYLKSVVPEVPVFDDSESRLQWSFQNSRAQGTIDDEIYIAFA